MAAGSCAERDGTGLVPRCRLTAPQAVRPACHRIATGRVATFGVAIEPTVRLSDAEREGVVSRLRDALSEGRLDLEDFQHRLDAVYSARTHGEVVGLTQDLPTVKRKRTRGQRLRRELREFAGVNSVLWGIWGAEVLTGGAVHDLWPLVVTIPWASWIVARNALGR